MFILKAVQDGHDHEVNHTHEAEIDRVKANLEPNPDQSHVREPNQAHARAKGDPEQEIPVAFRDRDPNRSPNLKLGPVQDQDLLRVGPGIGIVEDIIPNLNLEPDQDQGGVIRGLDQGVNLGNDREV